jgi:hypothetical protein
MRLIGAAVGVAALLGANCGNTFSECQVDGTGVFAQFGNDGCSVVGMASPSAPWGVGATIIPYDEDGPITLDGIGFWIPAPLFPGQRFTSSLGGCGAEAGCGVVDLEVISYRAAPIQYESSRIKLQFTRYPPASAPDADRLEGTLEVTW